MPTFRILRSYLTIETFEVEAETEQAAVEKVLDECPDNPVEFYESNAEVKPE